MIDEATRTQLTEVRTHLTAYATAMSGAAVKTPDAAVETPATQPTAATPPMTTLPATAPPAAQPPATGQPPVTGQPPAMTQPPATPPTTSPAEAPVATVDQEAARRDLIAARDTLNQLTQLPAAAQLTGEARTHVTQLIANFNELITTESDWPASYAKVSANMLALLGPEEASGEAATATPPVTGTTGAVGTSGTAAVTLDPAVRTKLIEMRKQLSAFEKASGVIKK